MWPKIFTTESYYDQKVAIVVLNTHTKSDSNNFFQLSTLLSSIQCYNFNAKDPKQIHSKSQREWLDDWARESKESDKEKKSLQRMWFIARNWPFAHGAKHGILDRNHTGEIAKLIIAEMKQRDTIFSETIYTYLMSENTTNLIGDLQNDTKNLTENIFDRQYLTAKKIHGEEIRVRHLYQYVEKLVSAFKASPKAADVHSVSLIQCKYQTTLISGQFNFPFKYFLRSNLGDTRNGRRNIPGKRVFGHFYSIKYDKLFRVACS